MNKQIQPVIIAGGCGARLWPLSQQEQPKQFIKFGEKLSLLQKTVLRNLAFAKPILIINKQHEEITINQLEELGIDYELILEPEAKGTAICSILAGIATKDQNLDYVLLIPADHCISDTYSYLQTIKGALDVVETSEVVAIGVAPTEANVNYGYVKCGKLIEEQIFHVEHFVEKPCKTKVLEYFGQKEFVWNSGIFLYKVDNFLSLAHRLDDVMFKMAKNAWINKSITNNIITLQKEDYVQIREDAIDCAFIEKATNAHVVMANFKWSDMGDFANFFDQTTKDVNNNYFSDNTFALDVKNSCVVHDKKTTLIFGLEDAIIISKDDYLLVSSKNQVHNLKKALQTLKII
jgi:mannose-1-phosphate guanylyltransferase/mannose-6-phosphate isomerase